MNKYQESLKFFIKLANRVPLKFANDEFCERFDKNIVLIKELVDRSTPVAIEMRNDGFHCPKCGAKIQSRLFYTFYCNECGQAFEGGMKNDR